MADPLRMSASIIAVTTLAYQSSKAPYDDEAVAAAQSELSKQEFGEMILKDYARGQQGIVGNGSPNVYQKFGKFEGSGYAEGFYGQMDSNSFQSFWNRPRDEESKQEKGEKKLPRVV
jgi:hypothetical protein